jgi:hypothetical protein
MDPRTLTDSSPFMVKMATAMRLGSLPAGSVSLSPPCCPLYSSTRRVSHAFGGTQRSGDASILFSSTPATFTSPGEYNSGSTASSSGTPMIRNGDEESCPGALIAGRGRSAASYKRHRYDERKAFANWVDSS